jgi:putative effector of murein hydrolase LrgA (UPF0299 family)
VLPWWPVLQANIGPIAGGLIVSTFCTMLVTSWVAKLLMRRQGEIAHGQ